MLLRVLFDCCRSRQDLALENLVSRHQLEVLLCRKPTPRLHNRDRILWVWMRWLWPEGWTRQLRIVQPETVIGWHRRGRRLYWSWRSRSRLGRPRLSPEVRELIARVSRESPLWGKETRFGRGSSGWWLIGCADVAGLKLLADSRGDPMRGWHERGTGRDGFDVAPEHLAKVRARACTLGPSRACGRCDGGSCGGHRVAGTPRSRGGTERLHTG